MKKVIVSAKNLSRVYESDGEKFQAIKNVNLEIYDRDFTVIMGSSGSGKSTLLYLLSGLDTVSSGEVYFEGQRIDNLGESQMARFRRESIGFVFQGINLVPNLSLFENVAVPGYLGGKNRTVVDRRAMALLNMIELGTLLKRFPSQVSGGQQQRAAIARGLINNPKLLFADEPTGSLNSSQGQSVLDILSDVNSKGQTVVMVTHDLKAACRADRIIFIKDGMVSGDFRLDKFSGRDSEKREKQVYAYLTEKGW